MKVIYDSNFINKNLQESETYYTIPASSQIKIVAEKFDQIHNVILNGKYIDVKNISNINCPESAQIVISLNDEIKTYETRAITKHLKPEFSDAYGEFEFNHTKTNGWPLLSILDGTLKMYAVEQSADVEDISTILKSIRKAHKAFKQICDKPKSHLKAVNEVKTIETVKRVGYESIPYLASHSEDWLAKTASGLKPARLFSRVEDDEYQIYENRFIKTAIDEICTYLKRKRDKLKDQANQIRGILNSNVQTNAFGFDASFARAVAELIQEDSDSSDNRSKKLVLADKLEKETTILWKKYRDLRHSKLYRYLKKAKNITNPLKETNILLMDKNYNIAFKFWKTYPRLNAPKECDIVSPDEATEQEKSYRLFCKTLCEYVLHTMKFEQINEGLFFRAADKVLSKIKEKLGNIQVEFLDARKRELKIERQLVCPLNNGQKYGKFEYSNQTLYWENDVTEKEIDEFCSLLKTPGTSNKEQAKEQRKFLTLKRAIFDKQNIYGELKVFKIVVLTPFCEIENETQNRFADYMKNIAKEFEKTNDFIVIAMPKCSQPEQRLTSYAKRYNEKTLFLPLTMFDINSYRRLQNLFLRMIIKLGKDKCPFCGSYMRGRECSSNECRLMVTQTKCDNPSCKHEYIYSYNARQGESIQHMSQIDENDFYLSDSLFQYKDIVPLFFKDKIKPICPKCGN